MTYITISTLTCFSHAFDFDVSVYVIDELSRLKYDGENGTSLLIHEIFFLGFFDKNEVPSNEITCELFPYMFKGCIKQWCHTLPTTSIHSLNHMFRELGHAFLFYDRKALN